MRPHNDRYFHTRLIFWIGWDWRYIGRWVFGCVIYFQSIFGLSSSTSSAMHLRRITVTNFSAHVLGESSTIRFLSNIQSTSSFFVIDPVLEKFILEKCVFQNISFICNGSNCKIFGLVHVQMVTALLTTSRAQRNEHPLRISDFLFDNISIGCVGVQCQIRGGCFFFSPPIQVSCATFI